MNRHGRGVLITGASPGVGAATARAFAELGDRVVSITVEGEVFEVTARRDVAGTYDSDWTSGPNPGYGFTSASSDGRPPTADHHRAITTFLRQIDPHTGYIE
jgi:NAD(P)-dependent dehydrogenase (short-subunit alcohol dehydrogenase family)